FTQVDGSARSGIAQIHLDATCGAGVIQFALPEYRVSEDAGTAQITLIRRESNNDEVSVEFSTANDTALAGTDFAGTTATVRFEPGELMKTVEVPVFFDLLTEGEETVKLTLTNPSGGAVLGARANALL